MFFFYLQITKKNHIFNPIFTNLEFNDAASKDIDLRVGILPTIVNVTSPSDIKKRISDEQSSEEPKSKKSKSEKIDL